MVDVELTENDYLLLEKWFGLLFGGIVKSSKEEIIPKSDDKLLFQKLSVMHISLIEERLEDLDLEMGDKDG